jgi:amino acid transporter
MAVSLVRLRGIGHAEALPRHGGPALSDQLAASIKVHRDRGLVRGIGTAGLAAAVVNGVVGAGIFTLPAAVALQAGAASPLAYLTCALIMAGVVVCFAEAGSRVPTSGGAYGTVEAAFGPAAGFVTGMLLMISDLLASGGIAAAVADMAGTMAPALAAGPPRLAFITGVFLTVGAANLVGVRTTARLITGATAIKLLPLLFFVGLGLATLGLAPPPGPAPTPVTLPGFGRALIITLFAFEGMETALMASGEVRDPNRTLPRALFLAMLFVLALYLGVQLSAQHLLGGTLAQAAAPLAEAAGRVRPAARVLMLGAAGLSMLSWMASDVLGTSRMLFAFGRDGRLPAWFGTLHPRSHVPANAVVIYSLAAGVLAMTGSFLELVVLSSLAAVTIYFLACAAALVLHRRRVALAGPPLGFRALPVAAGVGLLGMTGMVVSASWAEKAGLAGVVAGSLAIYAAMQGVRRRS